MTKYFPGGIPPAAALKLLKLRREGLSVEALTVATGLTPDRVQEVLTALGWPDVDAVDAKLTEIERHLDADPVPSTPRLAAVSSTPAPPAKKADAEPAASTRQPDTDPVELISRGKKSDRKRIAAAAARAESAAERLRVLLTEDEAKRQEVAARAAARAKAALEVKRLEAELAAAKQALNTIPTPTTRTTRTARPSYLPDGVTLRMIREWCAAAGVEVSSQGRIPNEVVTQYMAAQDTSTEEA